MSHSPGLRAASAVLCVLAFASVAEAGVVTKVSDDTFAPLVGPLKAGGRLTLKNVPLIDGKAETIQLEEFSVLAPDAVIEVHREDGSVDHVKPQPMRHFRGGVAGTPESLAYISVGSEVQGLIFVRDRKFSVYTDQHARGKAREHRDVYIEEIPIHEEVFAGAGFTCGVEGNMVTPSSPSALESLTAGGPVANAFSWPSATATTMINLAVDTDSAMYSVLGSNATTVETFVRNLIGATSTIYNRDLRTDIRISFLSIWTSGGGADPFTVNPGVSTGTWNGVPDTEHTTSHALAEYGDYWHANRAAIKRSAAMLLSGQTQLAGVAWIETLCENGFTCGAANCGDALFNGHRAGSYSYNGGVGLASMGGTTVPDPNAGVNYVAPASGYWALLEVAHELGHNVQSGHTHCIDTNPVLAGVQPVDACVGGCVAQGSVPAEKGTIMSYCHLRSPGFGTNTRYTFGQPGELSEIVITNMREHLDDITPTGFSVITAPASLAAGASGAASVTNTVGLTYDWTIVNGTINSGQGTNAINFTATTNPVTLRVTATNTLGCAITDAKNVEVQEISFDPPANVVATATGATTVDVSWAAVAEATQYRIYRASAHGVFNTLVGTSATTSFTDPTVLANTAYQYVVTAGDGVSNFSTFSDDDLAVTVVYTDPTLTAQSTTIKTAHFTQLLTAVNAVNTLVALPATSFGDPAPAVGVKNFATHVDALRTAVNTARGVLGYPGISYTDPTLTVGVTTAKAAHITELRNGLQ